jgi:hypothetical protein
MKNIYKVLIIMMVIMNLTGLSGKMTAQPDPPPLPDQHGYNGNQSTQNAPLDGGTGVLITLGIVYLAIRVAGKKKNPIADR